MGSSLSCCSDEKVEEGCAILITLESAFFVTLFSVMNYLNLGKIVQLLW